MLSKEPFNSRDVTPGHFRPADAASPIRLANDQSEVLRRRLQYAWDEIAHLTKALKEARGKEPEDGDGSSEELKALRGDLETLRHALEQQSTELESVAAERERLESQLQTLAAARDDASATANRTGSEVQALRQMVAQLRHHLGNKALESGGKEKEQRRLAAELKRRTDALEELQRRLKREATAGMAASEVASALPGGEAGETATAGAEVAAPTLDLSLQGAGLASQRADARSAMAVTGFAEPGGVLQGAPVAEPESKTLPKPWPARAITPMLWALPTVVVIAVGAVVVRAWYGSNLGPDAPTPGDVSTSVGTASPPPEPSTAPDPPADQTVTEARNPRSNPEGPSTLMPRPSASDRLLAGGQGPTMMAIGPATFTMGSSAHVLHPDEWPPHDVTVGRFLIGTREITFSEYDRFARSTGARLPTDGDGSRGQRPVAGVSWDDANAYTQWLSRQTNRRYRLPSEAEWEYAARGESSKSFWWGNKLEVGRAVCFDCGTPWDNRTTAPVASLAPNPFGLYDTAGNIMEWVGDCWNPDYTGAPTDARTRTDGDCGLRVARGGAFNKPAVAMRSAARYHFIPGTRIDMLGFRVVRED